MPSPSCPFRQSLPCVQFFFCHAFRSLVALTSLPFAPPRTTPSQSSVRSDGSDALLNTHRSAGAARCPPSLSAARVRFQCPAASDNAAPGLRCLHCSAVSLPSQAATHHRRSPHPLQTCYSGPQAYRSRLRPSPLRPSVTSALRSVCCHSLLFAAHHPSAARVRSYLTVHRREASSRRAIFVDASLFTSRMRCHRGLLLLRRPPSALRACIRCSLHRAPHIHHAPFSFQPAASHRQPSTSLQKSSAVVCSASAPPVVANRPPSAVQPSLSGHPSLVSLPLICHPFLPQRPVSASRCQPRAVRRQHTLRRVSAVTAIFDSWSSFGGRLQAVHRPMQAVLQSSPAIRPSVQSPVVRSSVSHQLSVRPPASRQSPAISQSVTGRPRVVRQPSAVAAVRHIRRRMYAVRCEPFAIRHQPASIRREPFTNPSPARSVRYAIRTLRRDTRSPCSISMTMPAGFRSLVHCCHLDLQSRS